MRWTIRAVSRAAFGGAFRACRCPAAFAGALGLCAGGAALCSPATAPPTGGARMHTVADDLFERNEYDILVTLLRQGLATHPDDAQLLWRLARGLKKQADGAAQKEAQKGLVSEALAHARRALELAPECGPVQKWVGITLSSNSSFEGTTASIKNSFVVAEHFERAIALSPTDATSRHLLGLWCYEVAKLSWLEKKAAAALFAAPPSATFDQAYGHFLAAEQIEPGFYVKNLLLLAQTCAKMGRLDEAKSWHAKCLASKPKTPEDEQTLAEAAKLKL